ncbi:MAG: hypothetical protein ABW252_16970 [Polyangiales bacterium]
MRSLAWSNLTHLRVRWRLQLGRGSSDTSIVQIKGTDAPDSARLSTGRAPTVGPLTPQREAGPGTVSLALSRTGRVLAEALARVLPEAGGLRVGQLLTAADHAMLAQASELVDASGLPAEQLRKLVDDLVAYRLLARAASKGTPRGRREAAVGKPLSPRDARPEAASARGGFLTLRAFGVRDEALARDILRSPAVRAGTIDRGFVSALLDPDVGPTPTVDLGFLRQLAGALAAPAPSAGQPAAEVSSMIARREARGFLARALSALALPTEGIATVTPDRATSGETLLRARMPSLLERLGAWLGSRTPSSASQPAQPGISDAIPTTGESEITAPPWLAARTPARLPAPRTSAHAEPSRPGRAPQPDARVPLTRDDRALLQVLYSTAAERGTDLRGVDDVAAALVAYRRVERVDAEGAAEGPPPLLLPREAGPPAHAEITSRPSILPRTYEAPRSLPPASLPPDATVEPSTYTAPRAPARPHIADVALPLAPHAPTSPQAEAALVTGEVPNHARSYGSSTQLAARLANTYGRLAPVSVPPPPSTAADYVAREAATRAVAMLREPGVTLPFDPSMPLDLGYALGLGALFTEVQRVTARTRRQRRRKKRQQLMRAIGGLRHAAAQHEAPKRDDASTRSGRRVRARAR